jgi:hypothetical protein
MKKSRRTEWRWNCEEQSGNLEENIGPDELPPKTTNATLNLGSD